MCNFFHILGLFIHEWNFIKPMDLELWPEGNLKDGNGERIFPFCDNHDYYLPLLATIQFCFYFIL